jgi:hypothetical protein
MLHHLHNQSHCQPCVSVVMPYSLSEFILASRETVMTTCTAVFGPQDALLSSSSLSVVTSGLVEGSPYRVGHGDSSLSAENLRLVRLAINRAWADSTRSRYRSRLRQFLRFCDSEGIESHWCLPASELLLCGFAASFRPPRSPMSRSMLELLIHHLDCACGLDMVVKACAMVCMWGQARLGELLDGSVCNSSKVPRGRDLHPPVSAAGSHVLHIPFTKTTRLRGADIVLCQQHHESNPVGALLAHIECNNVLQDEPLFSYWSSQGHMVLTKRIFLNQCNEIWSSCGLSVVSGHSFRIRGTTELLVSGVHPDVVRMMGRWSSDSFLKYWRSLDRVAPRHAEFLGSAR